MERFRAYTICFLVLLTGIGGCKEPFTPPPLLSSGNYLVVEGRINLREPTVITLTRSLSVTDTSVYKNGVGRLDTVFELGAQVVVEDDQGNSFPLPELGKGQYGGIQLSLNDQRKYRVDIKTANGEAYQSAFVPVLHTPPIDSITCRVKSEGAVIEVSTHSTQPGTGYYLWQYRETWEFHAFFKSDTIYDSVRDELVERPPQDQIYYCYQTDSSAAIMIGSSADIRSDTITGLNVYTVPYHSEKMSMLYSVMLTQYAISRQEYIFWQSVKASTEQLGTLFDPQPSNTQGNISCITHPDEYVIGDIGAGDDVEQRVFISNASLPADWNDVPSECGLYSTVHAPYYYWYVIKRFVPISDTLATDVDCADCTIRGTTTKPSFWP